MTLASDRAGGARSASGSRHRGRRARHAAPGPERARGVPPLRELAGRSCAWSSSPPTPTRSTCSRRSGSAPATTWRSRSTRRSSCWRCGARSRPSRSRPTGTGLRERMLRLEAALDQPLGRRPAAGRAGAGRARERIVRPWPTCSVRRKTSLLLLDEKVPASCGSRPRTAARSPRRDEPVRLGEGVAGAGARALAADPRDDVARTGASRTTARRARYDSGSFAVAPLLSGCAGDRCAVRHGPGRRPVDEDDLALLRLLAQQVARLLDRPEPARPPSSRRSRSWRRRRRSSGSAAATRAAPSSRARSARPSPPRSSPARILAAALERDRPRRSARRRSRSTSGAASARAWSARPSGTAARAATACACRRPRAHRLRGRDAASSSRAPTPARDPRFDAAVDTPADGRRGPLLCGPLRFRGKLLGVFRAFPAAAERLAARRRGARRRALRGGTQRAPLP